MDKITLCSITIAIPNTARPGTHPTIYDPSNVMGGQEYEDCRQLAVAVGKNGENLCSEHANTYERIWKLKLKRRY